MPETTNPTGGATARRGRSRLLPQLLIELVIGLLLAGVLVGVAWASSNAIRFVYGGY